MAHSASCALTEHFPRSSSPVPDIAEKGYAACQELDSSNYGVWKAPLIRPHLSTAAEVHPRTSSPTPDSEQNRLRDDPDLSDTYNQWQAPLSTPLPWSQRYPSCKCVPKSPDTSFQPPPSPEVSFHEEVQVPDALSVTVESANVCYVADPMPMYCQHVVTSMGYIPVQYPQYQYYGGMAYGYHGQYGVPPFGYASPGTFF